MYYIKLVVAHDGVAVPTVDKNAGATAIDGAAANGDIGTAVNRHGSGGAAAPSHRDMADGNKRRLHLREERWTGPKSKTSTCPASSGGIR